MGTEETKLISVMDSFISEQVDHVHILDCVYNHIHSDKMSFYDREIKGPSMSALEKPVC
jgi:hypothetical protein